VGRQRIGDISPIAILQEIKTSIEILGEISKTSHNPLKEEIVKATIISIFPELQK
jgi:hypothetical protein